MRNQSESKLFAKVRQTIEKNKESELFYKAFLKPMEISLKTQNSKGKNSPGSMPHGIKQVIRPSPSDNRFVLADFDCFEQKFSSSQQKGQSQSYEQIKKQRCDNLISLLKPRKQGVGIKVAICICMYSQDKSMLKRTISGVSQNIEEFARQGYAYNQIGVFVIMDGIEVVDASVESFFEELEKEHNIYLGDDVEPAKKEEILEENRQIQNEEVDNLNHLIFNKEELDEFKMMRFMERKKEYKTHKDMITNIQKLEKDKNLTYDSLDGITQRFFLEKAQEQYKKDYAASDDDIKNIEVATILQLYTQNKKTSTPLIKQALSEAKKYCQQYISSRDNLALMTPFRVTISLPVINRNRANNGGQKYEEVAQQNEGNDNNSTVSMNLFFITKYKNRGKLTSHNWFFNGLCVQLKPKYAILLDVGLVPERDSLFKMCYYMDNNSTVGGVCGYMGLRIQRLEDNEEIKDESVDCITSLCLKLFDIQRAQQFQYHFAHLIDKPFESSSCFKFIHVLPGAFSGYRMAALKSYEEGPQSQSHTPNILREYFKSIEQNSGTIYHAQQYSLSKTICKVLLPDFAFFCIFGKPEENSYQKLLYDENVYLAEDRTLCMGIHKNGYDLAYLPDAGAWVDPMKTLYGMLGQRKRWINGSYFAFEKVKQTLSGSDGECSLKIQIMYLTLMNWLGYISPALFMYTIHIAMYTFQTNVIVSILQSLSLVDSTISTQKNNVVGLFVYLIDLIYVLIFLGLVFFSMHLTNRQPKFKTFFYGVSTTYGIFSMSVFGVLIFDIISGFASTKNAFLIENPWFIQSISGGEATINSLRYIMLGIIGLYAFPVIISMIFCKFQYIVDILFSTFSFVFYSPTYLNILNIYALCRMDDISWGTKGLNSDGAGRKKQMTDDWKKIKILHVSKFVLYNIVVGFLLLIFGDEYVARFWLTFTIMILLVVTLGIKVIMATIYLLSYRFCVNNNGCEIKQTTAINDPVRTKFDQVKKSMYKQIEQSIVGIEKDVSLANNDGISAFGAIMSSQINYHFKFRQDGKQKEARFKKNPMNNWQSMSKIHRQAVSNTLRNSMKEAELKPVRSPNKRQPKDDLIQNEKHNTTIDKMSQNSLHSDGKKEQIVILKQPVNKVPDEKKKKKKTYL